MRFLTGLLVILLLPQLVSAAPGNPVDSLRQLLTHAPRDTSRLRLLADYYTALPQDQYEQRLQAATEGLRLAQRLHHRRFEERFQRSLCTIAFNQGDFVLATRRYQTLQRMAERPPVNPETMTLIYLGLGDVAGTQDDFLGAAQAFRKAIRWANQIPETSSRRHTLRAMAVSSIVRPYAFRLQPLAGFEHPPDSLLERAHYYINEALKLAKELRSVDEKASLGTLGNTWEALADVHQAEGQLDSAIYTKRRALKAFQQIGSVQSVLTQQQHLINLEVAAHHYSAAVALAHAALQTVQSLNQPLQEADVLSSLGAALAASGQWKDAYKATARALTLRDSVLSGETRDRLAEMQVRFDTERKEHRIKQLTHQAELRQAQAERRQQWVWALAVVLGVVLIGGAVGIVLYVRLRRSRAEMAKLTESKDRLYALVAHDLRGPMHALAGVSSMITNYVRRGDMQALGELPAVVTRTVLNLSQLLDNLLQWAASQTGALSFYPEWLPVTVLFAECEELYGPLAKQNEVELLVNVASPHQQVWADGSMVRAILRNLVGNALKFTPPGGRVRLAVETDISGTALIISDTGPGIPSEDAARLLAEDAADPKKLRRKGARGEEGTGLGLRLCRAFVRRHDGVLELYNNGRQGTVATVWFPLKNANR